MRGDVSLNDKDENHRGKSDCVQCFLILSGDARGTEVVEVATGSTDATTIRRAAADSR